MAEQVEVDQDAAGPAIEDESRPRDPLLMDLVHLADTTGFGFGVTLTVGGMLVSGSVISGREFVRFILDTAVAKEEPTLRDALRERYTPCLEWFPAPSDEDLDRALPRFIHLQNAKFYPAGSPSSTPSSGKGVLWRGAIRDVSGFFFGVIG